MDKDTWLNIKDIFAAALEVDEDKRSTFVDDACGLDSCLRAEVAALLTSHAGAENFIEQPAFDIGKIFVEAGDHSGKLFGNYRIVKEIGSGGMGAVFLAQRSDGEFDQQVAIKIIRQAIAESDLIKRFKTERQILASLNHPNIAKLLDGGVTSDGVPFLAMEYVEGRPITKFASENNLTVIERLKLFLKICSAVAFAHRNLIVHRDLKPSNIFVTNDGDPKLLDFGLAKLLADDLSNETTQTLTAFRALTPAYASPEQLMNEPITTISDIYSLGIVLYELLTDRRPFEFEGKSLEEIIRTVTEHEPAIPSSIEKQPIASSSQLKGDLDNIVLMALRKEPEQRYRSVEAFSEDIERYLSGLPVAALPLTIKYRTAKFVRRNKVGVLAASLIMLTLAGGIAATISQARSAEREKEKAETINAFLEQTLKYSNPILSGLKKSGPETTVNEVLDEAARRLDNGEFDSFPEVKAELERTVATTYFGQGKYVPARKHMEQYVNLLRSVYGENDTRMIAGSLSWAGLLFFKGEIAEAEVIYRKYLPRQRDEYKNGRAKPEQLAEVLNNFAYLRRTQGDSREAEALFRETLELLPQLSGEALNAVASTRSTLASTIADQGRFEEALQTAQEAVEEFDLRGDIDSPNVGFALTIYGGFLAEKGEYAKADQHLERAAQIFRKLLSPTSLWLADNLRNQAFSLYGQDKYAAAITKADETLRIYEDAIGKHYDHFPTAMIVKGLSLAKTGHSAEGEKLLREALAIRLNSLPKEHFWVAIAKSALGECLTLERQYEEAGPLLNESYENLRVSQGDQNPRTILSLRRLTEFNALNTNQK